MTMAFVLDITVIAMIFALMAKGEKMTEFFMWMTYIGLLLVVAGMFGGILFG